MDALLGTMSDAQLGQKYGFSELPATRRRRALGIASYRSTRGAVTIPCATCGTAVERKARDLRRSKKLFCSIQCAAAGQKRRDTDALRYGPGWKSRRAEVRRRDKVCRCCGKTPEDNGAALHVHHLKPFRFGGDEPSLKSGSPVRVMPSQDRVDHGAGSGLNPDRGDPRRIVVDDQLGRRAAVAHVLVQPPQCQADTRAGSCAIASTSPCLSTTIFQAQPSMPFVSVAVLSTHGL